MPASITAPAPIQARRGRAEGATATAAPPRIDCANGAPRSGAALARRTRKLCPGVSNTALVDRPLNWGEGRCLDGLLRLLLFEDPPKLVEQRLQPLPAYAGDREDFLIRQFPPQLFQRVVVHRQVQLVGGDH